MNKNKKKTNLPTLQPSEKKILPESVNKNAINEFLNPKAHSRSNALDVLTYNKDSLSKDSKIRLLTEAIVSKDLKKKINNLSENKINKLFEEYTKHKGNIPIKTLKETIDNMIGIIGIANPQIYGESKLPLIEGGNINNRNKLLNMISKFERGTGNKKYKAYFKNGRVISFGDINYQHYKDTTPLKLYSHLDHLDKKRKDRYYSRHNKDYDLISADSLSKIFLWS